MKSNKQSPSERLRQGFQRATQLRRERRNSPLLTLDGWTIFGLDEYNFVLTPDVQDSERFRYYPSLEDAIKGLLRQNIEEHSKPGLSHILEAIRQAERAIVAALHNAGSPYLALAENGERKEEQ